MSQCITIPDFNPALQPPAALTNARLTPTLDSMVKDHENVWSPETMALYKDFVDAQKVIRQMRKNAAPEPSRMPSEGTRLNRVATLLVTPAMLVALPTTFPVPFTGINGPWRVPAGYYGWINYVACEYSGGGFAEGSGNLVFSLGIQNYFYYGYGNIAVTLGSRTAGLWSIEGGLPLISNQYIQWFATLDNPAVAPGGYIICTIQGWIAPTPKGTNRS